jgi:formate hydrogenlyase subunit 6/NADH:ubiquinone oxidoreductase subunit I
MLGFLEQADREGLVLQPQNTVDPLFVCCCCGCCCGVLTNAKRLPTPAEFFQADFVAVVDHDRCQACGTCETRCQMDAITDAEGPPQVEEGRCIGCGLCVTTCPSEAIRLTRKERRPPPPKDTGALYTTLFKERYGQLGAAAALAGHWMGRKF